MRVGPLGPAVAALREREARRSRHRDPRRAVAARRTAPWVAATMAAATLLVVPPARAAASDANTLSAAWPYAGLALQTGLTAGTVALADWPLDDAMLRFATGLAAGAVPAGLLLWLWGTPCGETDERTARTSCWVEAAMQALVVTLVDGSAMFAAMLFVRDIPPRVAPPAAGLTAGWVTGWTAGTTVVFALPPLLGVGWGEDFWSLAGLFAWGHAALSTVLLAVVYNLAAPKVGGDWQVELPMLGVGGSW